MSRQAFVAVCVALFCVGWASAAVVQFSDCEVPSDNPTWTPNCTIHEVRIDPCAEAADRKPCTIKKGKSAAIEIDFTPNFASEKLSGKAFWATTVADLPFVGMEADACSFTTCPLQAGTRQTYAYQLAISKKFPVRVFDVKWRLYNDDNIDCCLITKIRLVK